MRVPNSPHNLKKVTPTPRSRGTKSDDEQSDSSSGSGPFSKPPKPQTSSSSSKSRSRESSMVDKENFLQPQNGSKMFDPFATDGVRSGSGLGAGYHRSRDRTRRSGVLRLLERRQAQKEKEKERERDRSVRARSDSVGRLSHLASAKNSKQTDNVWAGRSSSSHVTSSAAKTRSYSASEDTLEDCLSDKSYRRSSRSASRGSSRGVSQERFTADVTTKTYISIGPGKPTRIRENSPSKSPTRAFNRKVEERNNNANATESECCNDNFVFQEVKRERKQSNRPGFQFQHIFEGRELSPSKKSEDILKSSSPLKSASLLKDIPVNRVSATRTSTTTTFNTNSDGVPTRKRSFITEKTITISNEKPNFRRMSMDVSATSSSSSSLSSPTNSARSSAEREFSTFRPNSSRSSSFSSTSSLASTSSESSSDSVESKDEKLTKRRISLEERFKARASRIPSPERKDSSRPASNSSSTSSNNSQSSGFSSASSRLLYNLSSGYRYHRAAAAATGTTTSGAPRSPTSSSFQSGSTRRYSHDHSREFSQRKPRQRSPLRKISLPPTCFEDPERTRWDSRATKTTTSYCCEHYRSMANHGEGVTNDIHYGEGKVTSSTSSFRHTGSNLSPPFSSSSSNPYSNPKVSLGGSSFAASYKSKLKSGDSGLGGEMDKYGCNNSELLLSAPIRGKAGLAVSPDSDHFSASSSGKSSSSQDGAKFASSSLVAASRREKENEASKSVDRRKPSSSSSPPPVPPRSEASMGKREEFANVLSPRQQMQQRRMYRLSRELSKTLLASACGANDDTQSVSTVSGSGMDFFRKFVQRRSSVVHGCKECEARFRREVLIDRLVTDSLATASKAASSSSSYVTSNENEGKTNGEERNAAAAIEIAEGSSDNNACSLETSDPPSSSSKEEEAGQRGIETKGHHHHHHHNHPPARQAVIGKVGSSNINRGSNCLEESISTRSSLTLSTVSGSGLKFLRNYLRKKNAKPKKVCGGGSSESEQEDGNGNNNKGEGGFNSIPVPFPPVKEFYGPIVYPSNYLYGQECLDWDDDEEEDMYNEDGYLINGDEGDDEYNDNRVSMGSTIADLLNETFDSEDESELKNLDWDEWDESCSHEEDLLECDFETLQSIHDGLSQAKALQRAMAENTETEEEDEEEEEGRRTVIQSPCGDDDVRTSEDESNLQLSFTPTYFSEEEENLLCRRSVRGNRSRALNASQECKQQNVTALTSGQAVVSSSLPCWPSKGDDFGKNSEITEESSLSGSSLYYTDDTETAAKRDDDRRSPSLADSFKTTASTPNSFVLSASSYATPTSDISTGISWSRITSLPPRFRGAMAIGDGSSSAGSSKTYSPYSFKGSCQALFEDERANDQRKEDSVFSNCSLPSDGGSSNGASAASASLSAFHNSIESANLAQRRRKNDLGNEQPMSSSFSPPSYLEGNNDDAYFKNVVKSCRLADFWEQTVTDNENSNYNLLKYHQARAFKRSISDGTNDSSVAPKAPPGDESKSFQPAVPSYYAPEEQDYASERIQNFLDVTHKAAEDKLYGLGERSKSKAKRDWKRTSFGSTGDLTAHWERIENIVKERKNRKPKDIVKSSNIAKDRESK